LTPIAKKYPFLVSHTIIEYALHRVSLQSNEEEEENSADFLSARWGILIKTIKVSFFTIRYFNSNFCKGRRRGFKRRKVLFSAFV